MFCSIDWTGLKWWVCFKQLQDITVNFPAILPKHGFVYHFCLAVGCVVSVFMNFIFSELVSVSL